MPQGFRYAAVKATVPVDLEPVPCQPAHIGRLLLVIAASQSLGIGDRSQASQQAADVLGVNPGTRRQLLQPRPGVCGCLRSQPERAVVAATMARSG
jgi:hypothetical protein